MVDSVAWYSMTAFSNIVIVLFAPPLLWFIWTFYDHRARMRNLVGEAMTCITDLILTIGNSLDLLITGSGGISRP